MLTGRTYAMISVLFLVTVPLGAFGATDPAFAPPPNYHNATVRVTLLHQNGTPAVGYEIQMTSSEGSWGGLTGITNSTGKVTLNAYYSFWGPHYLYAVQIPNKRVAKTMLIVEPDGVYDITMGIRGPPVFDRTIYGTITNRSSGAPVAGLGISAGGWDQYDAYIDVSNTTDLDGRFMVKLPFIPNRVGISTFGLDYKDAYGLFFMSPDIYNYRQDIEVIPESSSPKKVELRLVNTTTGMAITDVNTLISGSTVPTDHAIWFQYPSLNPEGYFETTAESGEYTFKFEGSIDGKNVSYLFSTSVIVEGQDIRRDARMSVPDLALLEIRLWNGTAPMWGHQVDYSTSMMMEDGTFDHHGYTWTDKNGYGQFGVPTDQPVKVHSEILGYGPISYIFDPSQHTEPYMINLTAIKTPDVGYETGTVTVVLQDPLTGVNVPRFRALIQGSADMGSPNYYFQGNETGVLKATVRAGHYEYIEATSPLGSSTFNDFDVTAGGDLPLTLTLKRSELPGKMVNCTFSVEDPAGDPIPNLFIRYTNSYNVGTLMSSITTDQNGSVLLRVRPGSLHLASERSVLEGVNPFVFGEVRYDLGAEDVDLGTLTAFPALPKTPFTGNVKDSASGDALSMVYVSTFSYHTDEGTPYRSYLRYDPDRTQLSHLESFSEPGGGFRGWGNDQVLVTFQKEGYLPKAIWPNLFGRGPVGDIELEPVPGMDTFVSGTVVDGTDYPIWSNILVFDRTHDTPEPVAMYSMAEKGKFNISLYSGDFTIVYYRDGEPDRADVTVPEGGLTDLKLVHRPNAELEGFVIDPSGSRLAGLEVQLLDAASDPPVVIARTITNEVGFYDFKTYQGDHRVSVERSQQYDAYLSPVLSSDGATDMDHDIMLLNRSQADVFGKVRGDGGPYADGIPWTTVMVLASDDTTLAETTSDDSGVFGFTDVSHGTGMKLFAAPPQNLTGELNVSTGYLPAMVAGLTVSGHELTVDLELPYYVLPPPPFVNITDFGPVGTDIAIDAEIMIEFSVPMDRNSVESAISVSPQVLDMSFVWDENWTRVVVPHAPFQYNTTYTVVLDGSMVSLAGAGPWNGTVMNWSFTTVKGTTPEPPQEIWEIFSADVGVDMTDKDLSVEVSGRANMTIYIVIEGIGSFRLDGTMLGGNGTYSVTVQGDAFAWDTTYSYHFSNVTAGPDLAPAFKGTFDTPARPIVPDDDDDDGLLERLGTFGICLMAAVVVLVLVVLVVLVVVLVRKKGEGEEDEDEEEMSWDEE